jgi:drug/metabolite transporter (DMT)-like permease
VTTAAIALLILSALIHAGWNLISKRTHPTAGFFLTANLIGAVFTLPYALALGGEICRIPTPVWVMLAATGFFQAIYLSSLAAAYRHSDLSITYPIARSLPVVLVPIVAVLLGRGEHLSLLFLTGALLVLGGSLLVPFGGPSLPHSRNPLVRSFIMAVCAATGTAGYSLIDDQALRIIRETVAAQGNSLHWTIAYLSFEILSCSAWLYLFLLFGKREKHNSFTFRQAATAGLGMYLAYALVLVAMAHARDVSYIVAFRQVSILAGIGMGIFVLREAVNRSKIAGICLLIAGLTLVSMG